MEVEQIEINNLIAEYEDVFTGIRKLKGVKVKLHVVPEAPGAIQKQRGVSIPLKEKFDQILDRWQDLDIIEDVGDEPTDWNSNVLLTPKKDDESVRASLNMTDVNKYIRRTRHTIPTLRELETRLNGVLLTPGHERRVHAVRASEREQEADNVLHPSRIQAFQEAALWSEQCRGDFQ